MLTLTPSAVSASDRSQTPHDCQAKVREERDDKARETLSGRGWREDEERGNVKSESFTRLETHTFFWAFSSFGHDTMWYGSP